MPFLRRAESRSDIENLPNRVKAAEANVHEALARDQVLARISRFRVARFPVNANV